MNYISEMQKRAIDELRQATPDYKAFMHSEMKFIKAEHDTGKSGLQIASYRSKMMDTLIIDIFHKALAKENISIEDNNISILAVGGYGRGHLNPFSDIDLLFLLTKPSRSLSKPESESIQHVLYTLWDLGLKLGHATRDIDENLCETNDNQQSKTALMDARCVIGSTEHSEELFHKFEKNCLTKHSIQFFELRKHDISSRHHKYSRTVFLQEPHVKESCGGLRDFQNVLWIGKAKKGFKNIQDFNSGKVLTKQACKEMAEAYDFLHRVRNELHFINNSGTDILTLRLQGVIATNFQYPEKSILRRCESFMRDYYRHTRALYQYTLSCLEVFDIEIEDKQKPIWNSWLANRRKKREEFDTFISKNSRIYLAHKEVFSNHPHQLIALFLHCQKRNLDLAPITRQAVKKHLHLVDDAFRHNVENREVFRGILENKGLVAKTLRQMHRVGFLGAYLPEFGAMDCLVQHEFFHRYTADEHTLRCIDQLDLLVDSDEIETTLYRKLLNEMEDPYTLYLALILHDTGRAENVREHTDGSALLTSKVCSRLKISGRRRKLLMFLVDHHLSFWRFATNRNIEDPNVIEEFAGIIKEKHNLSALFLFTFADSNGTNEEAWSPWKESLMVQLYHKTMSYLEEGKEFLQEQQSKTKEELRGRIKGILEPKYHEQLNEHFAKMPNRYFLYRDAENIAIHVRAARRFLKNHLAKKDAYYADLRWIDHESRGYTDLIITCWNSPLLLEKACCALAANEINIISADVFTRKDGLVCDILRVSTLDWEAISSEKKKNRVYEIFTTLCSQSKYNPKKYLIRKETILKKVKSPEGIPFPIRAVVLNSLSDKYSAIQVQALDRIGLLHDLFLEINKLGLATVNARICTEKGAALNTIYVRHLNGEKITDDEKIKEIESKITNLLS